jgi:hypothetical protein
MEHVHSCSPVEALHQDLVQQVIGSTAEGIGAAVCKTALSGDQHRVSTCLITPAALHSQFLVQQACLSAATKEVAM